MESASSARPTSRFQSLLANPSSSTTPKPIFPAFSWRNKTPTAKVRYIRDPRQADIELSKLRGRILGFDLEWKPNFSRGQRENPVALVQLANADTILLLQITAMAEFPRRLKLVLEDQNIVKAGVAIQDDCKKLYNEYSINVRNCCDLSLLARSVDNAHWKGRYSDPIGLTRLVETYEQRSLPKGKVQCSNWELPLSSVQQEYAANDAFAGFCIYLRLSAMARAMSNIPGAYCYSFNYVAGRLCDPFGMTWAPGNPDYDPGPPPPKPEPKPVSPAINPKGVSPNPALKFQQQRMTSSNNHRHLSPRRTSELRSLHEGQPRHQQRRNRRQRSQVSNADAHVVQA